MIFQTEDIFGNKSKKWVIENNNYFNEFDFEIINLNIIDDDFEYIYKLLYLDKENIFIILKTYDITLLYKLYKITDYLYIYKIKKYISIMIAKNMNKMNISLLSDYLKNI